jgi:alpha-glucuronidase
MIRAALAMLALAALAPARAETGYDAWLRYKPLDPAIRPMYARLPAAVVAADGSPALETARQELLRGVRGMLGRTLRIESRLPAEDAIVLATFDSLPRLAPGLKVRPETIQDSYFLETTALDGHSVLLIAAPNDRGVLYGVFAFLRLMALHREIENLDVRESPYAPIRWTNEWDNLDGTIERGYAGRSIFFENGHVAADLGRVRDYARLLASIGIDGCTVNNVNADLRVLKSEFIPELARLAGAFRPWGVRMSIAVDFSSPKAIGGLDTFDPLDPRVAAWWKQKVDELYEAIPDLGGILLKADSEGRLGPSAYGRTHADAANVIARALKPHGGILLYRGFVYDHHMDWRNPKNDRARAAYDNFHTLDGKFDDNVAVQIKYGPIDFQVREPVSPIFGGLHQTNETIELQVTQEYTGQQRHLCFLVPMWKEILDFDLHAAGGPTPVKELVSGRTFHRPTGGFAAVTNVGLDKNWLGHDLAMANLYGFGRLAWNPDLGSREIADEWTRLTFGDDARVVDTVVSLLLESWPAYEDYTGPLGAGGLTDILHSHYGPGIESSERNGWGQWHRADEHGIGMERSVATGTGFIGQYPPAVARQYESVENCPDNLLLFMHHVPYTHVLHSGKTVIQHIYDSHYDGAARAQTFPERWKKLRGRIDGERFHAVLTRLEYQAGHAIVWRDAVCNWFRKMSGIPDSQGRVGNHPGRVEAESMTLDGYAVEPVTPWETASGGKAIGCPQAACSASLRFEGKPGWYRVAVQYFDEMDGVSHYRLLIGGQTVDEWQADDTLPSNKPDGHTSTRRTVTGVALRPGDEIRVEATTDAGDRADIDYLEIRADPDAASNLPLAGGPGSRRSVQSRGREGAVGRDRAAALR